MRPLSLRRDTVAGASDPRPRDTTFNRTGAGLLRKGETCVCHTAEHTKRAHPGGIGSRELESLKGGFGFREMVDYVPFWSHGLGD